jgi:predicted DNA-binding transcriptional regulator AlpA
MTRDVTLSGVDLVLRLPDPVSIPVAAEVGVAESPTWRERLWTCHAETRLGIEELCEALGRSKAFVYRHTRAKTIPHRRLDGELIFVAGEVREWLGHREETVVGARSPLRAGR